MAFNTFNDIVLNEKKFIKRLVKKAVLKVCMPFFDSLEDILETKIEENKKYLIGNQDSMKQLHSSFDEYTKQLSKLEENVKSDYNKLLNSLEECKKRLDVLEENIRNNNSALSGLVKNAEQKSNIYKMIDYFDFEDHFRGSRELIKERQKQYISYYKNKKNVIDLGCGRGEFLELLGENDISAIGIDAYSRAVEFCRSYNLNVVQDDAINFLKSIDRVDGIFAAQLIEHMTCDRIIELCELAYLKLEVEGYFIVETPNPMSMSMFTHAFYIDPSHEKPVHPYTVKYYLEKAGFSQIEIVFPKSSRLPVDIPELKLENCSNINEFNQGMKIISEQLFSSQDYAIIAKK